MRALSSSLSFSEELPDAAAFKRLYDTTGWGPDRPDTFYRAALQGTWRSVSVWQGGELVAFGRVISDGVLHALITEMIVQPGSQGQGLGREVLRHLLRACQEAGIGDVQLFAARGKAAFYEKEGFCPRASDAPGMQWVPA